MSNYVDYEERRNGRNVEYRMTRAEAERKERERNARRAAAEEARRIVEARKNAEQAETGQTAGKRNAGGTTPEGRSVQQGVREAGRETAGRNPGSRKLTARAVRLLRRDGGARLIITVVLLLFIVLSYSSFNLYQKKLVYDKQIRQIEEQIASEQARTEEIDAYEEYVGTDEYVEQIARDRLGLVYPNEIIFRPEE